MTFFAFLQLWKWEHISSAAKSVSSGLLSPQTTSVPYVLQEVYPLMLMGVKHSPVAMQLQLNSQDRHTQTCNFLLGFGEGKKIIDLLQFPAVDEA